MTIEQLSTFSATDKRGTAAIELVTTGQWQRAGSSYTVHGYAVTAAHCSCPSFRFSQDQTCKHSLCAQLLDALTDQGAAF